MQTSANFLEIISLLTGIASIAIALVAIRFARTAEAGSQKNFESTQKMMTEFYDKTKDVLAAIDKRATVTEKTVTDSQEKLLNTVTSLLNEAFIPKKEDMGEKFGMAFMQLMMNNPEAASKMLSIVESWKKGSQGENKEK